MGNQATKQSDTVIINAPTFHKENFIVSIVTLSALAAAALVSAGVYVYKKCKDQLVRELRNSADIA